MTTEWCQDYSWEPSAFRPGCTDAYACNLPVKCMVLGTCFSSESLAVINKHTLVTSGRSAEEFRVLVARFTAWTEDEKRTIAEHSAAILAADPTFCVDASGPASGSQRLLMASFTAWTEDEKRTIAAHSAAILAADPTFCVGASGPASGSQRLLVNCRIKSGPSDATRRKAAEFGGLAKNKEFGDQQGFIKEYNVVCKLMSNSLAEATGNPTSDRHLFEAYQYHCTGYVLAPANKNKRKSMYVPVLPEKRQRLSKGDTKRECFHCHDARPKCEFDPVAWRQGGSKRVCEGCRALKAEEKLAGKRDEEAAVAVKNAAAAAKKAAKATVKDEWACCDRCDKWLKVETKPETDQWYCYSCE